MSNVRWEKWAAASGIAFVPLFIGGGIWFGSAGGEFVENVDPAVISARLSENGWKVLVGATLAGLAAAAFLWFAGSLRAILRPAEGGAGRLSAVMFGGGVLGCGIMLLGALLGAEATYDLADHLNLEESATALYSAAGGIAFFGSAFAVGIVATAASLVMLRTGAFPKWLAIWGLVAGILLVLGWATFFATFIAGIAGLIWIVVTSILAIRRAG